MDLLPLIGAPRNCAVYLIYLQKGIRLVPFSTQPEEEKVCSLG